MAGTQGIKGELNESPERIVDKAKIAPRWLWRCELAAKASPTAGRPHTLMHLTYKKKSYVRKESRIQG
jgi:hypothetical protein